MGLAKSAVTAQVAAELTAATGVRHVHVVEGMIGW
jgi:hypothetical protein